MLGTNILTPYIYNIPRIFATVIKPAIFFKKIYVKGEKDGIVCHAEFIATRIRIDPMSFPHKIRVIPAQCWCHSRAPTNVIAGLDPAIPFQQRLSGHAR